MIPNDELKAQEFFDGDLDLETAQIGHVQYVREPDGTWRYADSWIKVPGARDLTLSEKFQPKYVIGKDDKVERIIVAGDDIHAHPELLEWCLEVGAQIRSANGKLSEVLVPFAEWLERDRVPGALVAPENSENPARREVAEVERSYREAERAFEFATEARAEALRRNSSQMTRQEAHEITGLSIGRVQQLIRSDSLDDLDRAVLYLVRNIKPENVEEIRSYIEDEGEPVVSVSSLRRRLMELEKRSLILVNKNGFRMTEEGERALDELINRADIPEAVVDD